MFKTIFGLAFKKYILDYDSTDIYLQKYNSDLIGGWLLIVSLDDGKSWGVVSHINLLDLEKSIWQRGLTEIWDRIDAEKETEKGQIIVQFWILNREVGVEFWQPG